MYKKKYFYIYEEMNGYSPENIEGADQLEEIFSEVLIVNFKDTFIIDVINDKESIFNVKSDVLLQKDFLEKMKYFPDIIEQINSSESSVSIVEEKYKNIFEVIEGNVSLTENNFDNEILIKACLLNKKNYKQIIDVLKKCKDKEKKNKIINDIMVLSYDLEFKKELWKIISKKDIKYLISKTNHFHDDIWLKIINNDRLRKNFIEKHLPYYDNIDIIENNFERNSLNEKEWVSFIDYLNSLDQNAIIEILKKDVEFIFPILTNLEKIKYMDGDLLLVIIKIFNIIDNRYNRNKINYIIEKSLIKRIKTK